MLAMLLAEVRELRAQVAELGQVKNQEEGCKLLFDFSQIRKQEVMMCFVELYERFAILGTKDHLQTFLSEQTVFFSVNLVKLSKFVIFKTEIL